LVVSASLAVTVFHSDALQDESTQGMTRACSIHAQGNSKSSLRGALPGNANLTKREAACPRKGAERPGFRWPKFPIAHDALITG
jgi:hypothetical protein